MASKSIDIRKARASVGETQAEFGERFGVDQSTIQRWETNGLPKRGAAKMLAEQVLASLTRKSRASIAA